MTTVEILKQLPPQMVKMYLAMRQQILFKKREGTYDRVNKGASK